MKKKNLLTMTLITLIAPLMIAAPIQANAVGKRINTRQVQTYNSGRCNIYAKYMKANATFAKSLSKKEAAQAKKNAKLVSYNNQVYKFNVHVNEVTDGVRLTAESRNEKAEKAFEKISNKENKLKGNINQYKRLISQPTFKGLTLKNANLSFKDWLQYQDGYYQDNVQEWNHALKYDGMTLAKYNEKIKPYRDKYAKDAKKIQDRLASNKKKLATTQKELADFKKKNDTNFNHYYGRVERVVVSNKKGKIVVKFSAVSRQGAKTFKPSTRTVKATFK
jgi:hypothetical protein